MEEHSWDRENGAQSFQRPVLRLQILGHWRFWLLASCDCRLQLWACCCQPLYLSPPAVTCCSQLLRYLPQPGSFVLHSSENQKRINKSATLHPQDWPGPWEGGSMEFWKRFVAAPHETYITVSSRGCCFPQNSPSQIPGTVAEEFWKQKQALSCQTQSPSFYSKN